MTMSKATRRSAAIRHELKARARLSLEEQADGLPGFDISLWHGLWVPKGTPKNIVAKLNAAVMDAFVAPTARAMRLCL
jgi:hypothetical protein